MLKVYQFNFNKSSIELNLDYERLTDIDKEKLASLSADGLLEYEHKGKYAFMLLANPTDVSLYTKVLDDNFVRYEKKDISEDIIKQNINLEKFFTKNISISIVKYQKFLNGINKWIYDNLDIDTILDRINLVGIESLTNIEKKYLENYKQ